MSLNNNMENMTKCEEMKTALESIETLKKEFDLELEKAKGGEDLSEAKKALARARELKAEMDEKKEVLEKEMGLLGYIPFLRYVEMTSEDWEGMEAELDKKRESGSRLFFSTQAMKMKILDPSYDLKLGEEEWKGMGNQLNEYRENGAWNSFSTLAMKMKILDPSYDLKLGQEDWEGMENRLNKYRKNGLWDAFSTQARRMKILDPNYDLKLGKEEWKGMKNALNMYKKNGQWYDFSRLAMEMKILSSPRLARALAEGRLDELK